MKYEDNSQTDKQRQDSLMEHVAAVSQREPWHCENCDIEFLWTPTVFRGETFCCTGCAAGGPCCCDYSQYAAKNISGVIHYGLDEEAAKQSSDNQSS